MNQLQQKLYLQNQNQLLELKTELTSQLAILQSKSLNLEIKISILMLQRPHKTPTPTQNSSQNTEFHLSHSFFNSLQDSLKPKLTRLYSSYIDAYTPKTRQNSNILSKYISKNDEIRSEIAKQQREETELLQRLEIIQESYREQRAKILGDVRKQLRLEAENRIKIEILAKIREFEEVKAEINVLFLMFKSGDFSFVG